MKTKSLTTLIASVALWAFGADKTEVPQKWQKDWAEFGNALGDFLRTATNLQEANAIFAGREVEWTGKVAKIIRGDSRSQSGTIQLEMPVLTIPITETYKYGVRGLLVTPLMSEWGSWTGIKEGDTVNFRTRFTDPRGDLRGYSWTVITFGIFKENLWHVGVGGGGKVSEFIADVRKMDTNKASVVVQFGLEGGKLTSKIGEARVAKSETAATTDRFSDARPEGWPNYAGDLDGHLEVRIKNPNDFNVRVALRSRGRGRDLVAGANSSESVRVPEGRYDIYFQYSSDPKSLYQGDTFTLGDRGIEIQIVRVVNGNYGIRKVK